MKKYFMFMLMAVVAVAGVSMLSSCGDDDEGGKKCTFRLEVKDGCSSSGDTDKAMEYMNSVNSAYEQALGMTDSEVSMNGAASDYEAAMKQKFESATLPAAPDKSVCGYTFTLQLVSYDYSSKGSSRSIIASKTFSNQ